MGLVDYDSDSDSEEERPVTTDSKPSQATAKKPFQKVVDRSNPGRIVINLPSPAPSAINNKTNTGEPPAKRVRKAGGGLFSNFNSFLPPPKNIGKQAVEPSFSNAAPRPGVNLKTSAAVGFSRDADEDDETSPSTSSATRSGLHVGSLSLPLPKNQETAPLVPAGQQPVEEVKLVGQTLMFRPLSVGINAEKKMKRMQKVIPKSSSATTGSGAPKQRRTTAPDTSVASPTATAEAAVEPAPKKKNPLFSMHVEEPSGPIPPSSTHGAYEPLFETPYEADPASTRYSATSHQQFKQPSASSFGATESLDYIADDLNLSAAARRELFGRDGSNFAAKKVVNFNMDREYQHNEDVRASGDKQIHHPVRALQSGKHSLKQLVQNVQNQKEALEDSFAKGRCNRKEASSRYGW